MKPALWPMLGAVRFFLALVVAAAHVAQRNHFSSSWWVSMIDRLDQHAAVMAFFVISGYSIAASYAKEPNGYYRRRILRIWPLYALSILFGCATAYGTGQFSGINGMPPTAQIVQNLFFLQGWSTVAILTNLVAWSLSIEVAYYVLAPVFARISQPLLLLVAVFSEILYFAYMYFFDEARTPIFMIHGRSVALMMWFWLAGFIAFRGGIRPNFTAPKWLCSLGTTLGDVSYPFYLFHWPLYASLVRFNLTMSAGSAILFAILVSWLLDRYFDQPLKSLFKRKSRPLVGLLAMRKVIA